MDPQTHDAWLAQAGTAATARLARITSWQQANVYEAEILAVDVDGALSPRSERTISVTNIAEPAEAPGQLAAGTDLVALDIQGRWITAVSTSRPATPCRVVSSGGGATYTVRPQVLLGGAFTDDESDDDRTATNLAELDLGLGGAIDVGAIVLVSSLPAGETTTHVFDRSAYAKYLD